MTEKRFKIVDYPTDIIDVVTDKKYPVSSYATHMEIICDLLNDFNDENEQLKKRNNRQAKQLDRLYHLIEEKDWRTLSDILDDFKRCEKQLQREWGTYGDVE